ncbi:hypothetical protein, partial [Burkholderia cepacia]|uniref:hypothetical protein n=1 Tax=Burkholderia cepacia TaxID=292 RepID=UPI00196AEED8
GKIFAGVSRQPTRRDFAGIRHKLATYLTNLLIWKDKMRGVLVCKTPNVPASSHWNHLSPIF